MKHEIGEWPVVSFDTKYGQIIDLDKTRMLRELLKGLGPSTPKTETPK